MAVDLLRDADAAMYAAKSAGGGARLFEDNLRRSIVDRVALGRELRGAGTTRSAVPSRRASSSRSRRRQA